MRLRRVESIELVEFPDTMEGLFGKVRWWAYIPPDVRARLARAQQTASMPSAD